MRTWWTCEYHKKHIFTNKETNASCSIEDQAALQAKVDEALSVYDEYVKSSKTGEDSNEKPAAEEKA